MIGKIQTQLEAIKGSRVEVHIPSGPTPHSFTCTCPSPTHPDHHPSCLGDLVTGHYKCLGCGFSGDLEL